MSLQEIEKEMQELKREIRETPIDEQDLLHARLAHLSRRWMDMKFPRKPLTTHHEEDTTEE